MKIATILCFLLITYVGFAFKAEDIPPSQWIRINQLGYTPAGVKVAIWCSKDSLIITSFDLIDSASGKSVLKKSTGKNFGTYGPFKSTYRLNFSSHQKPGTYYLKAGKAVSPTFKIGYDVYKGAADFCLQYMRQQRSGFNPYLKDSCHTHDGYTLYGPMPDSTHIDVVGGWHDASDYLQYSSTSANATYHLLAAYRDFPKVFTDTKQANGLDGKNGLADVMDEAKWGLDWLLKMHPQQDLMFNQLGDDRDHMGMRIPKEDSFYGRGYERPVYFISGLPQQRGKFMNNTTGTSSTAAKFASAFSLGSLVYDTIDLNYALQLHAKASTALAFSLNKPGVSQTVSVKSPYIYAEDNWVDDMELAYASGALHSSTIKKDSYPWGSCCIHPEKELLKATNYARREPITPWLGEDTAKHYQWYPFINLGHYELAKQLRGKQKDTVVGYYKTGIQRVWNKAKSNAFYRGIPFIWCSNNLTTSFAMQCYWYKQLTVDKTFDELEQANFDWLFGCNPWGTSMVYGLPSWGDTPVDPHSAFTHLKNYPINGGLVDGPVYTSIYKGLIGITLKDADEYATFQSDLAVYHDDYGDYSSNEPTMDGTASLIYLLAAKESEFNVLKRSKDMVYDPPALRAEDLKSRSIVNVKQALQGRNKNQLQQNRGAIVRGDISKRNLAIVFTGDEFADGGEVILKTLQEQKVKASFFLTGRFYRNNSFKTLIEKIKKQGHYLGPHSDQHLLYSDWSNRDSLFVTKQLFEKDLEANLKSITQFGVKRSAIQYFIPPYEWYNDSIAAWTREMGLQLINYSPGTKSTADYTYPELPNYRSSDEILKSIVDKETSDENGLNGFILLVHIGTDPQRTDKFYNRLEELIKELKQKGYAFKPLADLFR